jgi:metal-responsive CopG/Arc/MetJ family transcriptional regulator
VSVRETIGLQIDEELLRQIDALAAAKGITRHEAARVALRLGIEITRTKRGAR